MASVADLYGVRVVEEGEEEFRFYMAAYTAEPPAKKPFSCAGLLLSFVVTAVILSPILLPGGGV